MCFVVHVVQSISSLLSHVDLASTHRLRMIGGIRVETFHPVSYVLVHVGLWLRILVRRLLGQMHSMTTT